MNGTQHSWTKSSPANIGLFTTQGVIMPMVGGKEFPYTKSGMAAAKKAAKKKGMKMSKKAKKK